MHRWLPVLALLGLMACTTASSQSPPVLEPAPGSSSPDLRTEDLRTEEVDLGRFFDGIEATFVLYEPSRSLRRVHDPGRAARRFVPASTFKIANTLVALETGVIRGPDHAIAWDTLAAPPDVWWPRSWRRDQTLRSAFQHSVYWYYQEVARRIGAERMQAYLDRFDYGNRDMGGGLDRFWLGGDLRISPYEQVAFLERFYTGALGLSERTTRLAKEVMVLEAGPGYRLSGKTGTAEVTPTRELGWLVGFVERGGEVAFYALNMEGERVWEDWPPQERTRLVRQLLAELGAL